MSERIIMDDRDATLRDVERIIEERLRRLTRLRGMRGEAARQREIEAREILRQVRELR